MNQNAAPRLSLPSCPECGNRRLQPVGPVAPTNLLCHRCGACWTRDGDEVSRVDPVTCAGCGSRRLCLAALAERSP
ncbi:MAG TPA: hypothetical protein VFK43_18480 [Acidimicrobiales bacterium]|nr:hypothetical protein [Acidimicrobiales bacterium]